MKMRMGFVKYLNVLIVFCISMVVTGCLDKPERQALYNLQPDI
jgi:hypothetical protein